MGKVTGVRAVIKALQKHDKEQEAKLRKGITLSVVHLFGKSQDIVPVDEGNLRASEFMRVKKEGKGRIVGRVGYTADYAIYVHEDLELRHGADYNAWYGEEIAAGLKHDRGPNQQAKFLEQPFRTERRVFAGLIRGALE